MNNNQQFLIPLAIVVAGALVAAGIFFGGKHFETSPAANNPGGTGGIATGAPITSDGNPFIGDPKAPLTIYYWSDYQCPYCKQFESNSLQTAIKDYVNTKKAKVVFKDLQFLGKDSIESAHIARAVWELYPDRYYAWREGYFAKQDDEGDTGFGNKDSVIAYTRTVSGIDADKVAALSDQKADEYQAKIQNDGNEGAANQVTGTPGVIVGNQFVPNPLTYSAFKQIIDSQLK